MEEDAALIAVAEIAVAIAGFSGIAAALRHRASDTWPVDDRDRFADLVTHSGIALFASLVPLTFAYRSGLCVHPVHGTRHPSACRLRDSNPDSWIGPG